MDQLINEKSSKIGFFDKYWWNDKDSFMDLEKFK